ncbi:MAG: rhamnulokinase, partial [Rubripirellula sp.]|nr:rhamnulokinase [Rubripirellula sp.]
MQQSENHQKVYLAVDLGASSGRVIAGILEQGKLELNVIHRFENSAVKVHDSLQWDVLSLWKEIQQGLRIAGNQYEKVEAIGVDTWGVDYVLV